MRYSLLCVAAAALAAQAHDGLDAVNRARARAAAQKPNIIWIMSDDLGYGEIDIYPSNSTHGRIATPNISRLFQSGVHFTSAYAGEAVCAPSRCALMTGYHTGHTHIRGNLPTGGHDLPLRLQDYTFASMLQSAGYATHGVGKWGLGYNGTTGEPWLHGFSTWYGQLDQNYCHNMYPSPPLGIWDNTTHVLLPQNADASRATCMAAGNDCFYTHDAFTNRSLQLIAEQAAAGPSAQPMFLYLSYTDPHAGGWQGIEESGNPVPSDGQYANQTWPDVEKDHASVITNFQDRDVGLIWDLLQSTGLDQNTLLIFASDNGAHNEGGHDVYFFDSSGPLRGFKRSLYEGGIRTASAVVWPGQVPANVTSDHPWAFWDVMPTLADLLGIAAPNAVGAPRNAAGALGTGLPEDRLVSGTAAASTTSTAAAAAAAGSTEVADASSALPTGVPSDIDGVSVLDIWLGQAPVKPHPAFYYEFCTYHDNNTAYWTAPSSAQVAAARAGTVTKVGAGAGWGHAVRLGDWKAVSFAFQAPLQLYNVTADIGEQVNLADQYPAVVAQLQAIANASHTDNPLFPIINCVAS